MRWNELSGLVKAAPDNRRGQEGTASALADLADEMNEVLPVNGMGLRVAHRILRLLVVVAELDEHPIPFR